MFPNQLIEQYNKVPKALKFFLIKALLFFVGWQLLYHGYLIKTGFPNNWLTHITAVHTADMLRILGYAVVTEGTVFKVNILFHGQKIIGIADPCNALEVYILYLAFLVCFPARNMRRIFYCLIGVPTIYIVNVLRCVLMTFINLKYPSWSEISHHYIFTTIVYLIVFALWVSFTKQPLLREN